jgi:hypothetical protein
LGSLEVLESLLIHSWRDELTASITEHVFAAARGTEERDGRLLEDCVQRQDDLAAAIAFTFMRCRRTVKLLGCEALTVAVEEGVLG